MSPGAPELSPGLLQRHLEELARRRSENDEPGIPSLALRAGGWSGPDRLAVAGQEVRVRWCPSGLAVRAALAEPNESGPVVVLTALSASDLGLDVLARLYRRRIEEIDRWEVLLASFGAKRLDRRLENLGWLADELLAAQGLQRYPVSPTGILDFDTAWRTFLGQRLGLESCQLPVVLQWLESGSGPAQLRTLGSAARAEVIEHVRATGGEAAGIAFGLAARGDALRGDELRALPIGLVLRVVVGGSEPGRDQAGRHEAAIRLEAQLGGRMPSRAQAQLWATEAEAVLRDLRRCGSARAEVALSTADLLLEELRAGAWAGESDVLLAGFARRLELFVRGLRDALEDSPASCPEGLEKLAQDLSRHQGRDGRGADPEAALRLVRWLAEVEGRSPAAASFIDAVDRYTTVEGWVDFARTALCRWLGQLEDPAAAAAIRALLERVGAAREAQNRRFGELLQGWLGSGSAPPWLVPVEQILDRVVVPLAREVPVLVVVVDGASVAVIRELLASLEAAGWSSRVPSGPSGVSPGLWGLAALPSVTAVSRTSLLAGVVRRGTQQDEKRAFEAHPGLRSVASRSHPKLFHKADLRDSSDSGLAEIVRAEVAGSGRRIVGVVINAVDDDLAQEQIPVSWRVSTLGPLGALLAAAREAGRAVVLTSDHGHVHEWGLELRTQRDSGDRWRSVDDEPAGDGEILVSGPRVLGGSASSPAPVIVPWSEKLRYGRRKAGYHGGASPQELIVPLQVVAPPDRAIAGWVETATTPPSWWVRAAPPLEQALAPVVAPRAPVARPTLFDEPAPAQTQLPAARPSLIDRLFSSEVLAEQLERYPLGADGRSRVRRLLEALEQAGWRSGPEPLCAATGTPALRLPGLVGEAQKLLNVEGYMVLDRDEGSIHLDRELLLQLFELGSEK